MTEPPTPHRWRWSSHDVRHTVLLPVLVAVITLVGVLRVGQYQAGTRPVDALGIVLLAAGPVALLWRRVHPPAVLLGCTALLLAYIGLDYSFGPVPLAALVALATAVTTGHRTVAYSTVVVAVLAGLGLHAAATGGEFLSAGAVGLLAWFAAFVAGCEVWRSRRERIVQARAARAETESRLAAQERLRIARELHDVLGHHVSLINVQAGVALYLLDSDREQAREALTVIKESSRDLLREMRSTLGVLRGIDEPPPREPTAGLERLARLVEENAAAGLPVHTEIDGDPAALPPTVDLAAFRIVQEALTNVRKHAAATRAEVRIRVTPDTLGITIDDDGTGAAAPGEGPDTGTGLAGMRERAAALGGRLTAGPGPGRGFRVAAELPVGAERGEHG